MNWLNGDAFFGFAGQWDDLYHYLECAPFWSISCHQIQMETPLTFAARLCLVNPSKQGVQALALAFSVYHFVKNQPELIDSPALCQNAAFESAKSLINHL